MIQVLIFTLNVYKSLLQAVNLNYGAILRFCFFELAIYITYLKIQTFDFDGG